MKIQIKSLLGLAAIALGIISALNGNWPGIVASILTAFIWVDALFEERKKDKEIEKLKRQANPRKLSAFASGEIASSVSKYNGQNVCLFYPSDNDEAFNFTKEIARALRTGGLNVSIPRHLIIEGVDPIAFDSPEPSSPISIACTDSKQELARTLSNIFVDLELAPLVPIRSINLADEGEAIHARQWPDALFLYISQKDV
jgi:hypothetical protein